MRYTYGFFFSSFSFRVFFFRSSLVGLVDVFLFFFFFGTAILPFPPLPFAPRSLAHFLEPPHHINSFIAVFVFLWGFKLVIIKKSHSMGSIFSSSIHASFFNSSIHPNSILPARSSSHRSRNLQDRSTITPQRRFFFLSVGLEELGVRSTTARDTHTPPLPLLASTSFPLRLRPRKSLAVYPSAIQLLFIVIYRGSNSCVPSFISSPSLSLSLNFFLGYGMRTIHD